MVLSEESNLLTQHLLFSKVVTGWRLLSSVQEVKICWCLVAERVEVVVDFIANMFIGVDAIIEQVDRS